MHSLRHLSWSDLVRRLEALKGGGGGAEGDALLLAQELHVHQVELEMQNRELREAQGRLEASHARYAELYDRAPVGYATLDRNGIVLEINLTAAALFGRERDQLVGVPFTAVAGVKKATTFLSHLRATEQRGSNATIDIEIEDEGQKRYLQLTTALYFDFDRVFRGFLMTIGDVTERTLLEHERRARQEADQANRMKDQFLGIVSHELRTPLNAIIGWIQILSSRLDEPEVLKRGLDIMLTNGRALARLVEDILDVSRIVNGKMRMDRQKVDVTAATQSAIDQAQPAAHAKNIALGATIADGIGLMGDEMRLQQVVANLLGNAIKFTEPGGHIDVALERLETSLRLTVRDDGCGVNASDLGPIFEHFRQADSSTTRAHAGLGLGLAIARHIVEAHGGTIAVRSPGKGHGSTLVVEIPRSA